MSTLPRLRICLLASEVAPLSKTGGLADVAGALGKVLSAEAHDVRLFTPAYSSIDLRACGARPVPALQKLQLSVGTHSFTYAVLAAELPGGAPAYLIDCPALFARPTLYTQDADEHVRFLFFTRAALECCVRLGWSPTIVHCNDWHTAFAPLYLRTLFAAEPLLAGARTLLTIHNIGYQGIFSAAQLADVGLAAGERHLLHQSDLAAGRINPLRHGILYADAINTVSPTHAREICTDELGMGLQDSLRARGGALSGILNGVDYAEWDPRHDRHLPEHFSAADLAPKARLKAQFLARLGLEPQDDVPLAGIVSRLAAQKGIELMFQALPRVLSTRPLSFVALGSGEPAYETFFASLPARFPGRVHFKRGYDDELAHWIEGACDLFLMPSRYEPCGLNQMYSLRYGTVPVVRRTGGLADSVQPYDRGRGSGTGVVFNDFDAPALEWALNTALDLYAEPAHWARLLQNGMAQDFSWQHQALEYVALYRRLSAG
ncbi:MAG: glycogen synthase [Gammaproteobacteria bacterium]|nr:glycogen synthase [Gammaproteobacteria bacterium]MBV9620082.1 glycogen synthase [Gammaproteobacteria bacterium]